MAGRVAELRPCMTDSPLSRYPAGGLTRHERADQSTASRRRADHDRRGRAFRDGYAIVLGETFSTRGLHGEVTINPRSHFSNGDGKIRKGNLPCRIVEFRRGYFRGRLAVRNMESLLQTAWPLNLPIRRPFVNFNLGSVSLGIRVDLPVCLEIFVR